MLLPPIAIGGPIHLLVIAVLIAVFTYLRDRSSRIGSDGERPDAESARRPVWVLALTQIIICVAGEFESSFRVQRCHTLKFLENSVVAPLAVSGELICFHYPIRSGRRIVLHLR
jgi:hypothetical protein